VWDIGAGRWSMLGDLLSAVGRRCSAIEITLHVSRITFYRKGGRKPRAFRPGVNAVFDTPM
jgi:hypothetical protein